MVRIIYMTKNLSRLFKRRSIFDFWTFWWSYHFHVFFSGCFRLLFPYNLEIKEEIYYFFFCIQMFKINRTMRRILIQYIQLNLAKLLPNKIVCYFRTKISSSENILKTLQNIGKILLHFSANFFSWWILTKL